MNARVLRIYWGFSSVVPVPASQIQGPKFDPRYPKKKNILLNIILYCDELAADYISRTCTEGKVGGQS